MLIPRLGSGFCSRALVVALLGTMTTGCYTTTLIPAKQASRLAVDALSLPGELRAVRNVDGELVVLGESFTAQIEVMPGLPPGWVDRSGAAVVHSPLAVDVRGPNLVLSGSGQHTVAAPLASVKQIRVREFSPSSTVGLILGIVAGSALVGFAVTELTLGRMQ